MRLACFMCSNFFTFPKKYVILKKQLFSLHFIFFAAKSLKPKGFFISSFHSEALIQQHT